MKNIGKLLSFNCLLCMVIGLLLGCFVLCGYLHKSTKESFHQMGAPLQYKMTRGVPGLSRDLMNTAPYAQQLNTHSGPTVPLPEGQLFNFYDTAFSPSCCVPPYSGVSSSDGCACVTKEQVDYINMRGGNRSPFSIF